MQNPQPISYYSLIVDFNAPKSQRYNIHNMARSQIKNYYENKAVPDYFRKFEQIFRKYSDLKTLEANLDQTGMVTFNSTRPNVLFSNPYNPDQNLFLVIAVEEQAINNLINKFQL